MKLSSSKILAGLTSLSLFYVTNVFTAQAHESSSHELSIIEQHKFCNSLINSTTRLRCFDDININQPQNDTEIDERPPAKPQASKSVDSKNFGLPKPAPTKETIDEFTLKVSITSWRKDHFGALLFTTSEGQIWKQQDNVKAHLRNPPVAGTITQTGMGGYRLRLEGKRYTIKVKRIK